MLARNRRKKNHTASRTQCECIHCSLVVIPLVSQRCLELDVRRLEVDARDGYFAIFIEYGGGCDWRLGREGRRNSNG